MMIAANTRLNDTKQVSNLHDEALHNDAQQSTQGARPAVTLYNDVNGVA
jgi:hypothetical protein